MKAFIRCLTAVVVLATGLFAHAQNGSYVVPDPYILSENSAAPGWSATSLMTPRSAIINPTQKTLVLIVAGQSNWADSMPSVYVPTHASAIDQINIYDGALYPPTGPLLGATYTVSLGPGNIAPRVADTLIANGKFDRVIIGAIAIAGASVADWSTFNLNTRTTVLMRRLAARQITPSTPGVTFAFLWGQGETDTLDGTSTADYTTSLNQVIATTNAAGFSGRYFICEESWVNGAIGPLVEAAQIGIVNNTTIFSGGNLDTLNDTFRVDQTHFTDAGAAAAATLVYNAMHASGAPY